jgi:hypothetical protein
LRFDRKNLKLYGCSLLTGLASAIDQKFCTEELLSVVVERGRVSSLKSRLLALGQGREEL